jgi:hypothetical protein
MLDKIRRPQRKTMQQIGCLREEESPACHSQATTSNVFEGIIFDTYCQCHISGLDIM